MNHCQRFTNLVTLLLALSCGAASAAKKDRATLPSKAPTTFAPLPEDHELASIWNDPEFARRLVGSYGFDSAAEPKLQPEELSKYNEEVVPLLKEDPKKAIPVLEKMVGPKASALFDFVLGNIHFQNGDLTNAATHFEQALIKFPDFRRAQKNMALTLVRQGKYGEAIQPLARTIELGGGDARVFGLLGFAYSSEERFASAEAAYRQALILDPENLDFKLGWLRCAVASANYDHALALLDELIKQQPEKGNLWALQANIYITKGQPDKAALSLEMLRRLGMATAANLFQLGDLYMTQEARDLALGAYVEALEKDGGQNPTKALRPAQILVSRGAWEEARQLFSILRGAGAALEPADELTLLKLESKAAMATGEGEKAIETLEQIIAKDPLDGEALLLAGDYYARNGQPEKAEFRYDAAAKLEGFEADACVKHAQLLIQTQKYAEAVDLLRKAQRVKPRDNVQRYLEKVEQLALTKRS